MVHVTVPCAGRVDHQFGLEAIGIAGFGQKLLRPFRVVGVVVFDFLGPLLEWGVEPDGSWPKNPVRSGVAQPPHHGVVDCLEVPRQLHCVAHPDVVKGRFAHIHGEGVRHLKGGIPQEFGVGPLDGRRLVEGNADQPTDLARAERRQPRGGVGY